VCRDEGREEDEAGGGGDGIMLDEDTAGLAEDEMIGGTASTECMRLRMPSSSSCFVIQRAADDDKQ
jgi:hypothetical protein